MIEQNNIINAGQIKQTLEKILEVIETQNKMLKNFVNKEETEKKKANSSLTHSRAQTLGNLTSKLCTYALIAFLGYQLYNVPMFQIMGKYGGPQKLGMLVGAAFIVADKIGYYAGYLLYLGISKAGMKIKESIAGKEKKPENENLLGKNDGLISTLKTEIENIIKGGAKIEASGVGVEL